MKKIFSLLLVALILVGNFNYMPTAKAVDATELFYATSDGFSCDGTITYTVFIKQGITFSGASVRFKYDSSVLEVQECEPFMTEDSYGDPIENIPGIYECGNILGLTDVYGCIFIYGGDRRKGRSRQRLDERGIFASRTHCDRKCPSRRGEVRG